MAKEKLTITEGEQIDLDVLADWFPILLRTTSGDDLAQSACSLMVQLSNTNDPEAFNLARKPEVCREERNIKMNRSTVMTHNIGVPDTARVIQLVSVIVNYDQPTATYHRCRTVCHLGYHPGEHLRQARTVDAYNTTSIYRFQLCASGVNKPSPFKKERNPK